MVLCSSCQEDLPSRGFSQNQRHKDENSRRCKVCVERSMSGNQLAQYQSQIAQSQQHPTAAVASAPIITIAPATTSNNNNNPSVPNAFTSSEVYRAATDPQRSQRQTDYFASEVQRLEDLESFVQDEMNCPICFEEMSLETDCHYRIVVLGCSHSLCFHCYARMKKKQHEETAHAFPCPICRRECTTASELPRAFKILLQYAIKYSKLAESMKQQRNSQHNHRAGAEASPKQQPLLVQNSNNNNGSKHLNLQNFTTGTICIVNAAQQCGAVRLDDVLPGRDGRHPMTFFFNTSPRFRELQAGMFVKFRIDEQGNDPNRWVAKNVEPFEDHNSPHRRNGNDDDSGPSLLQRQQQEAERQRQAAERQRQEELQLMEQRENERLRRVHRQIAERQQQQQQQEEQERQRQAQLQRDHAERQRLQQEAARQRLAQIRQAEEQEEERLRRAQRQREHAERQRQRAAQLAQQEAARELQRQLEERQQEEARRVNEIRRQQQAREEEHRREQQWREQEFERQQQERAERRRLQEQEEYANRQRYSAAATTNTTNQGQGCLIA